MEKDTYKAVFWIQASIEDAERELLQPLNCPFGRLDLVEYRQDKVMQVLA